MPRAKKKMEETPRRGPRGSEKLALEGLLGGRSPDDFGRVHVFRHEDHGARTMLGVAQPADLRDRLAFGARFGGGTFTLVARSPDNRRIAGRFRTETEGAALPAPEGTKREGVAWPHATGTGQLQAVVFPLFREGCSVDAVVDRTRVDARALRALYLEWLTDFGEELPTTPDEVARRKARAAERRKGAIAREAHAAG